jgi:hypothetical protein
MSDFDAVLERLLTEPAFARALAADPAAALAGYRLSAEEIGLLSSQVSADTGGQQAVETRANKSSVFGLLSPLAGLAGGLGEHGIGGLPGHGGAGEAARQGAEAAAGAVKDSAGIGGSLHSVGLGDASDGFGHAAPEPAHQEIGAMPPEGYHTRVDVDGDGDWDRHIAVGRPDGGVDILVDLNHDGNADFVGHDDDADGLVESADYAKKTMYDDDGDGWLDRTVARSGE